MMVAVVVVVVVVVVLVVVTSDATTYSSCGSGPDGRSVTSYLRRSVGGAVSSGGRFPYSEVLLLAIVLFVVLFVFITVRIWSCCSIHFRALAFTILEHESNAQKRLSVTEWQANDGGKLDA